MELRIACVVEGHGDREAVPVLIRRIVKELDPAVEVQVPAPIRTPKSKLVKDGELERAVELAGRTIAGRGGVLVVLDSDDDCPAELGPRLRQRAIKARGDLPLAVVLPKREFEAWFLAAAESLAGYRGLPRDLRGPGDPEAVGGAKEWLSQRMGSGQKYVETLDQAALAARFDLGMARRAGSFDKCYREIVRLLRAFRERQAPEAR